MKRFAILLITVILLTLCAGATNIRGDVDLSGKRDVADMLEILRAVVNREALIGADVNRDGKTSIKDALVTMKLIVNPPSEEGIEDMILVEFVSDEHSPKAAADMVMAKNMIRISTDDMKGTHDAHYVFANGKAYVVYEANDKTAGDLGTDPAEYCALAIVDLETFKVESIEKFAYSEQVYTNETLPAGSCFVPRVIRKDENTLRFFFASQYTDRQALTYYVDYDLETGVFEENVYRLKLLTDNGMVDLTPAAYIDLFRADGRECADATRGVYLLDIFDIGDTKYIALNNFNAGQNSLAKFNDTYDCIEIIGNIGSMTDTVKTTENGIMQLNDGTWMAILRNERGDKNYLFSYSEDGVNWSYPTAEEFVQNGTNSKPTLANFDGYYFMGWNESSRGLFHIAYSFDAKNWVKLYSFYSDTTFQYPEFDFYNGQLYFSVTMGSKEQIWFGKLDVQKKDGNLYINETAEITDELFSDVSDFTLVHDSVQISADGRVCKTYIKRDNNGVYFYGETAGNLTTSKLFFMLDTVGTATSLGTTSSPDNLMFRIYNGVIQVKALDANNTRTYKSVSTFESVRSFVTVVENGTKTGVYIPYSAISEIAPYATCEDLSADFYIAVYGAEGSAEYVPTLCGQTIDWDNPSTYVILTSDGTLKAR